MKKYILFDLDGTLTDPKIGITTCVQYALAHYGIEEPNLDKLEPFIGPPLTDSFEKFYGFDKEKAKEAVEKYRERFSTVGLFENEIYPGVKSMLRKLHNSGMRLAVASSKPQVFVEKILDHFKIRKYFDVVVGSELDGRRVNKDEVVEEALRQLFGHNPVEYSKVYMIGDRCFDVEGARAVGVESIGVTYGYGGLEELKEAHADYIVQSVPELADLLYRETRIEHPKGAFSMLVGVLGPIIMFQLIRELAGLGFVRLGMSNNLSSHVLGMADLGLLSNTTLAVALSFLIAGLCMYPFAKGMIREGFEQRRLQYLYPISIGSVIRFCLGTVALGLLINVVVMVFQLGGLSKAFEQVAASQWQGGLAVGILCYGIIAPWAEEVLFRGILYNRMRREYDAFLAAVLNGLIFGVYHMNIIQGVYAAIMGYLFCRAYEKFGRFIFPVLMHMLLNTLVYVIGYFL